MPQSSFAHSSLISSHSLTPTLSIYYFLYLALLASSATPAAANASQHHHERHRAIAAKSRRAESKGMLIPGEKPQKKRVFTQHGVNPGPRHLPPGEPERRDLISDFIDFLNQVKQQNQRAQADSVQDNHSNNSNNNPNHGGSNSNSNSNSNPNNNNNPNTNNNNNGGKTTSSPTKSTVTSTRTTTTTQRVTPTPPTTAPPASISTSGSGSDTASHSSGSANASDDEQNGGSATLTQQPGGIGSNAGTNPVSTFTGSLHNPGSTDAPSVGGTSAAKQGPPKALIAGIVIGVLLLIGLCAILAFFIVKKRQKQRWEKEQTSSTNDTAWLTQEKKATATPPEDADEQKDAVGNLTQRSSLVLTQRSSLGSNRRSSVVMRARTPGGSSAIPVPYDPSEVSDDVSAHFTFFPQDENVGVPVPYPLALHVPSRVAKAMAERDERWEQYRAQNPGAYGRGYSREGRESRESRDSQVPGTPDRIMYEGTPSPEPGRPALLRRSTYQASMQSSLDGYAGYYADPNSRLSPYPYDTNNGPSPFDDGYAIGVGAGTVAGANLGTGTGYGGNPSAATTRSDMGNVGHERGPFADEMDVPRSVSERGISAMYDSPALGGAFPAAAAREPPQPQPSRLRRVSTRPLNDPSPPPKSASSSDRIPNPFQTNPDVSSSENSHEFNDETLRSQSPSRRQNSSDESTVHGHRADGLGGLSNLSQPQVAVVTGRAQIAPATTLYRAPSTDRRTGPTSANPTIQQRSPSLMRARAATFGETITNPFQDPSANPTPLTYADKGKGRVISYADEVYDENQGLEPSSARSSAYAGVVEMGPMSWDGHSPPIDDAPIRTRFAFPAPPTPRTPTTRD